VSDHLQLPLDELLQVTISEDRMQAILSFKHTVASIRLSEQDLADFLDGKGVRVGLETDVLRRIAERPSDFFGAPVTVANGVPPVPGKDGYIRLLYDTEKERKPAVREDGTVDFKDVVQLANVKAGQIIAERVSPEPGIPGMTVTGEEVPAKPGKEAMFKIGKNVVLNPEKTALYATIDGLVTKTDNGKINVFPVYEVNGDVDYNIGNIDFVGTVVIRGNVLTGFRVRAAGDIRVIGGVEGAELEADGSIEVTGGIIGHHKGYVKAKRNVKCAFVQEGNVTAGEDVIVSQSIMHSNVRAGRMVQCTGAKGLIVGGVTQAGERVIGRMIGNSMSTATTIEVGVHPELRQELTDLRQKIRQLTESLEKTEKALNLLDQMAASGQLPPDKMAMRIKLSATRRQTEYDLQEAKDRTLEIEKTLEDTTNARVDAVNTIWGGTKIVIGRYTRFIKDHAKHVTFRIVDGEVAMIPLH
jgi:uncharacterized protein